ncbi:MAG: MBL fold metallo-hydrolase [Thermofilum sp.]
MLEFTSGGHRVVVFRDLTPEGHVQANQVVFVDEGEGLLADPGGRAVFNKLIAEIAKAVPALRVKYLFFSHQDPDILGAAAAWYSAAPQAKILIPSVWQRFLPHAFQQAIEENRVVPIPDEGGTVKLGSCELKLVPAHFLHSPGNFQIYDPVLKLLYSGDLFASLLPAGLDYDFADDLDSHLRYMEVFLKRYIPTRLAIERWLETVKGLEIEVIVPQHGALIRGRENVARALEWLSRAKGFFDV